MHSLPRLGEMVFPFRRKQKYFLKVCLKVCPSWWDNPALYFMRNLRIGSISVCSCPSVHLSVCLSLSLYVHLFICPSICMSVWISICPSVPQTLCLCFCLSVSLSLCLTLTQFLCASVCISICLSFSFPSVCLSVFSSAWNMLEQSILCDQCINLEES